MENTTEYKKYVNNLLSTSGGKYYIGKFNIIGTGSKAITGVGFKPKMVKFYFTNNSQTGLGNGGMTSSMMYAVDHNSKTYINSECIYIRNSGGSTVCRAVYSSLDDDGFTINTTYFTELTIVQFECYG